MIVTNIRGLGEASTNPCVAIINAQNTGADASPELQSQCTLFRARRGIGNWNPDCGASISPCDTVARLKETGGTYTAGMVAKCEMFAAACGSKTGFSRLAVTAPVSTRRMLQPAGGYAAMPNVGNLLDPQVGPQPQAADLDVAAESLPIQDTAFASPSTLKNWLTTNKTTVGIGLAVVAALGVLYFVRR